MVFLVLYLTGLLAAAAHATLRRSRLTSAQRVEMFLLYQFAFSFGLLGLVGFAGHSLNPEPTAALIGWPAHPQFQFELGAAELGWAIASFLCLYLRNKYYWLGVTISPAVMFISAAILHVREATAGNLAPYNVGVIAPDLLVPLTVVGLLVTHFRQSRNQTGTGVAVRPERLA